MSDSIKKNLIIIFGIIVIILLILFVLPVSLPIVFALITALFLAPAVTLLMDKAKLKRGIAVFIVFVLFILLLLFAWYFILTRAISQLNNFITLLPYTINELTIAWNSFLENMQTSLGEYSPDVVQELDKAVINMLYNLRQSISNIDIFGSVTNFLLKIPSYIVSLLFYVIALYLFLLDLPRIKKKLFNYLSEKTAEKVKFLSTRLYNTIFGFIKAQLFVSVIIFLVTLVALFFIAPDVAIIMSIIIWIIDVIPIIGSIVILAPWGTYHIIAGNTTLAIQLFVLAAILLTIRRTVEPKVMGDQIGLSPLATLLSLYVGMKFIGVLGFFVGPLVVILFTSAREAGIIKFNFKI